MGCRIEHIVCRDLGGVLSSDPQEVRKMIAVGSTAPDFELADDTGQRVRLSQFRGQKVILYFYPKALTKG